MIKKSEAFFVVSRYNEDWEWIKNYTDQYIICNKGESILDNSKVRNINNIGANQRDILEFIYENYKFLPKLMLFIQANPFDHCKKETFDKLIYNDYFTPIEDYSHLSEGSAYKKDIDGGYMEVNSSWYIPAHNSTFGLTCNYSFYDQFMNKYFENYDHVNWIRFTPGSQYLIEKKQALKYPRKFWYSLMNELNNGKNPTEGHIIERALWYIFKGNLLIKEEYSD